MSPSCGKACRWQHRAPLMPHTYISTAASPFRGLQKLHASCRRQALQQSGANAWMLGIHRLQPSLARGVPLCGALESRQLAHWESDTKRDDRAESQHRTVCTHKKDLHAQSSRRVPLRKSSSSGIAHIEPGHEQCRLLQDSCAECPAKAATGRAGVHVSATHPVLGSKSVVRYTSAVKASVACWHVPAVSP